MVQLPNPEHELFPDLKREKAGHEIKSTLLRTKELYGKSLTDHRVLFEAALSANFYDLLGVPPTASNEEIRRAYKTAIKTFHPDVYSAESDKRVAEKISAKLNSILECLTDATKRRIYDSTLQRNSASRRNDSPSASSSSSTRYRQADIAAEAERLRRAQEKERLRLEREAERLRSQQEAERLRKRTESERLRKSQEADRLRQLHKVERLRAHREAERLQQKREAEQGLGALERERLRVARENKPLRRANEAKSVRSPVQPNQSRVSGIRSANSGKNKVAQEASAHDAARSEDFLRRFLYHYHLKDELQEISAFIDFHGNLEIKRKLGKLLQRHCSNRGRSAGDGFYGKDQLWAHVKDYEVCLEGARSLKKEIGLE